MEQHGQSAVWAVPQLGSCASTGRTWRLWAAQHSQGEASPLGAQPLPRLLELATSQAAYFLPLTIQVEGLRALLDGLRPPSMVKVPPWQCPSSPPAPPQGALGGARASGKLAHPGRGWATGRSATLHRVPELAADFIAFDHLFIYLFYFIFRPPAQGAVHLSHWEAEWEGHLAAAAGAAPTAKAAGGAG